VPPLDTPFEQDSLTHAAQAAEADVATLVGEVAQVAAKALKLLLAVGKIWRGCANARLVWVARRASEFTISYESLRG
jgi:hypothetical protein